MIKYVFFYLQPSTPPTVEGIEENIKAEPDLTLYRDMTFQNPEPIPWRHPPSGPPPPPPPGGTPPPFDPFPKREPEKRKYYHHSSDNVF